MRCCMKFINRFLEIYLFVIPMHVMTMSENARFIYIYMKLTTSLKFLEYSFIAFYWQLFVRINMEQ